jgi:hypothetical protein
MKHSSPAFSQKTALLKTNCITKVLWSLDTQGSSPIPSYISEIVIPEEHAA